MDINSEIFVHQMIVINSRITVHKRLSMMKRAKKTAERLFRPYIILVKTQLY